MSIWPFVAWAAIGIATFLHWHLKGQDTVTIGDACMILVYGCICGAAIPVIIFCANHAAWFDRPIYRKRRSDARREA